MKWSTRIRQLAEGGWTYREIGEAVGLSKGAVGDLALERSSQPRADAGQKILALHMQYIGEPKPKRARV